MKSVYKAVNKYREHVGLLEPIKQIPTFPVFNKVDFFSLDKQMEAIYSYLKNDYKLVKWKNIEIVFDNELEEYLFECNVTYSSIFQNYIMYSSKYDKYSYQYTHLNQSSPILTTLFLKPHTKVNQLVFTNSFDTSNSYIFTLKLANTQLIILIDKYVTISLADYHTTVKFKFISQDAFINQLQIIIYSIINILELSQDDLSILDDKLVLFLKQVSKICI